MNIELILRIEIQNAIQSLFGTTVDTVQLQPTNAEFEGSHTLVCFTLTKISKKNPEETGKAIGEWLIHNSSAVSKYNVVKGFLNLSLKDSVWVDILSAIHSNNSYGQLPKNGQEIMVEYSSPNTNKPLHLGHLRNNFLGWSVAEIYKANGYKVHKVQIINDRGIHICKSMAAWKLYGKGETPKSSGIKGDHLVGKYYVAFNNQLLREIKKLEEKGVVKEEAEKQAPIMKVAVDMLRKWEYRDEETLALWKMMNGWVYEGFDVTYKKMGVDFDKLYYESNTYLLGKEQVLTGLEDNVFFKKEDGSVWVDLTSEGLDQKVLLRSDGTSVYMTQDIGTAILRFHDYPNIIGQIYTVGNEQEYHFKVLFLILKKLGYDWAKRCYHLSYGMVDLPTGKMKSREGTVVDADDLIEEMINEAKRQTLELGKTNEMSQEEADRLFEMIGLGALKFFLLKVDPKKKMLFDPNESIQLQGFTGPFIQYTHARIKAILRKAQSMNIVVSGNDMSGVSVPEPSEQKVIQLVSDYENKIREAAKEYSPAIIANYVFELAKAYNQFYQTVPIFTETDSLKLKIRIALSNVASRILKHGMGLLGISVPEKM
jgi:arginyl-tRNA synthetase